MTRTALSIAMLVALASTAAFDSASARHFVYVKDYNFSVNPKGVVEGRFSPTIKRACKYADKNKKYPGPATVAVGRFQCPGEISFVNQFVVK